ncbi:Cyclin-dependent protein kinase inhibitor SMR15 [Bienertia sinuspersici]
MSTDLEFLPSIINHTRETPTTTTKAVVVEVTTEPREPILEHRQAIKSGVINNTNTINNPTSASDENHDPITPTSDEFKIPAPRSPPPAPRKRRCAVPVACRKKLDFVDHINHPQLIIPKEEVIQEFSLHPLIKFTLVHFSSEDALAFRFRFNSVLR